MAEKSYIPQTKKSQIAVGVITVIWIANVFALIHAGQNTDGTVIKERSTQKMKRTRSAKDIAFDKERAKYCREIREMKLQINHLQKENEILRQNVSNKESEISEKDDWIRRLLEYMDLSEDDMKKIIDKDKTIAEVSKRLLDIDRLVSRFF